MPALLKAWARQARPMEEAVSSKLFLSFLGGPKVSPEMSSTVLRHAEPVGVAQGPE